MKSVLPARSPVRQKRLALNEDPCRARAANRAVQTRINGLDCRVLGREYVSAAESVQVAATLQHPHYRPLQVAEVKRAAAVLLSLRFPHQQLSTRNVDEIDAAADEQQMSSGRSGRAHPAKRRVHMVDCAEEQ